MQRIVLAYLSFSTGTPAALEDVGLTLRLTPDQLAEAIVALEAAGHVQQLTTSDGRMGASVTPAGMAALETSMAIDDIPPDVPETINAAFAVAAGDTFLAGLRDLGLSGADARLLRYFASESATRMAIKTRNPNILIRMARADALGREVAANL